MESSRQVLAVATGVLPVILRELAAQTHVPRARHRLARAGVMLSLRPRGWMTRVVDMLWGRWAGFVGVGF